MNTSILNSYSLPYKVNYFQDRNVFICLLRHSICSKLLCTEDVKELERIYNMFSSCLEYFEIQLVKTLYVQREFPLHEGNTVRYNWYNKTNKYEFYTFRPSYLGSLCWS